MNTETLAKANEIKAEIAKLKAYVEPLENAKISRMELEIGGYCGNNNTDWRSRCIDPLGDKCPEFLKESLTEDIEFIMDKIKSKISKHIKKLEKEFESL